MKAVITVVGKDQVGILAGVSGECAARDINILEVTQSVLQDMFCMIMMCDITAMKGSFGDFADFIADYGAKRNLSIHAMHEDIFNSMHRI